MAAEATALSSGSQSSINQDFADNFVFQLVDAVNPGNSVINLSFVTASEVYGGNFDELKASLAAHFTQHFQTPIRQVNLSVNVLTNNIMATPVEDGSPVLTEDTASPDIGLGVEHEATNSPASSPASKKAKQKVPRPPNAFIIYRKDWHSTVVAANPGVHNNAISVIIGKKWKNESQEVRDKYHRKAAEAKHQHATTNPGYQYQPRKPSEKKKRMTKNKLAKLAAKSASAKKAVPAPPLLTFNEDKSAMSFIPGQGAPGQLTSELEAFNNSKWTAAQQAAAAQAPFPALPSAQFVTNPVNMNDILFLPGPTTVKNWFASVEQTAFVDPSSTANYHASLAQPALDDLDLHGDIDVPGDIDAQYYFESPMIDAEVVRHVTLNEKFKDGLNDFFDFDRFDEFEEFNM